MHGVGLRSGGFLPLLQVPHLHHQPEAFRHTLLIGSAGPPRPSRVPASKPLPHPIQNPPGRVRLARLGHPAAAPGMRLPVRAPGLRRKVRATPENFPHAPREVTAKTAKSRKDSFGSTVRAHMGRNSPQCCTGTALGLTTYRVRGFVLEGSCHSSRCPSSTSSPSPSVTRF